VSASLPNLAEEGQIDVVVNDDPAADPRLYDFGDVKRVQAGNIGRKLDPAGIPIDDPRRSDRSAQYTG